MHKVVKRFVWKTFNLPINEPFFVQLQIRRYAKEWLPKDLHRGRWSKSRRHFILLFFRWMNHVIKTGSKRALEQSDFLPLTQENSASSLTEKLQTRWKEEKAKGEQNGKRPKFWKSVLKLISVKDVLIIMFTGILESCCRIFQPLFLGYLISSLMATTESRNDLLLYACAVAMGVDALIKSLCVQHFCFRTEVLGVRLTSAIKGVIYRKVCTSLVVPHILWINS